MAIKNISAVLTGQVGTGINNYKIITDGTLAQATATGALTGYQNQGQQFSDGDMAQVFTTDYDSVWVQITVTQDGVVSMREPVNAGNVTLPVVSGDFAVFDGTSGVIEDAGYSPSDATKTKVVMASAAVVANRIACFSDTAGTVNDDAATAINGGNIQAGLSGTAGHLSSFPTTAAKGSFRMVAADNVGDTVTTITHAAMGQATVFTLPDPLGATSKIVIAPNALAAGNAVKAVGTDGRIADAGYAIKSGTTAAYAGGGTSHAFTATGLTASFIVTAVILTSTNSVAITKAIPGTDILTVHFTADPGAATTVSWIATSAAVA